MGSGAVKVSLSTLERGGAPLLEGGHAFFRVLGVGEVVEQVVLEDLFVGITAR